MESPLLDPASSPLFRPSTEFEAPRTPSRNREFIGRYIPLAHDRRYGPLPAFLALLLLQIVILLTNFIVAVTTLTDYDALYDVHAIPFVSPCALEFSAARMWSKLDVL